MVAQTLCTRELLAHNPKPGSATKTTALIPFTWGITAGALSF